jgi:hypothetical protein
MGIGVLDNGLQLQLQVQSCNSCWTFTIRYTAPEHGCMLWNLSYRGENLDSVLFIILFSLTLHVSEHLDDDEGILQSCDLSAKVLAYRLLYMASNSSPPFNKSGNSFTRVLGVRQ